MSIISSTSITTTTNTTLPSCFISSSLSFSSFPSTYLHQKHRRCCCVAIRTGSQESYGPDLLRKPLVSSPPSNDGDSQNYETEERNVERERWVDWEDQILEDTVPLVGFVRMILHSDKYQSGDRLSEEHEGTIMERLLPYHPEYDKKVGCGVDYITGQRIWPTSMRCITNIIIWGKKVGYHPQFQDSRCLFIVRKDGELIDFSYWKCIKGFIKKNYPLYADSFTLKHFRRRRRYE